MTVIWKQWIKDGWQWCQSWIQAYKPKTVTVIHTMIFCHDQCCVVVMIALQSNDPFRLVTHKRYVDSDCDKSDYSIR